MIPLVLAGASVGAGLVLVTRSMRARPLSLGAVIQRAEADARVARPSGVRDIATGWIRGGFSTSTQRDLAVSARSAHRHASEKLTTPIGLGALVSLFGVTMGWPPMLVAVFGVIAIAFGVVLPDLLLTSAARERRNGFRHALSSYLDLVNVLLAGGAGVETALEAASDAGDGWVFEELRACLVRSRATHRSPWACFAELGEQFGVDELVELSAMVQLAGEQGARIRTSLATKASTLRAHQLARIEADAQAASERMGVPTVLMFLGFLLLLGYPAAHEIMRL